MKINVKTLSSATSREATRKSSDGLRSVKSSATIASLFKEETKTHMSKCFNEDVFFSKIERSFRRDFMQIKEVLQSNYQVLVAIFDFYAG
mmetsp:Transcript_14582/g.19741  ORF Transcript_14582/g.19741 Transcript_14582/m.19741 type:complete len:90 (-) Transcript_14582:1817-2086(-)